MLIKLPNKGGDRAPTIYFVSSKLPVPRFGYI